MENKKEVTLERVYDAPLESVWKAWTDPEQLKKWWGPNDVTIPECELDLRVGGEFYIVMEAGEGMGQYKGTRWPMRAQFTEIAPKEKLAYTAKAWTEGDEAETTIEQTTQVAMSEEGGKTKLVLKAIVHKTGPKAGMAVEGMQYGFGQQLEKLNTFLAK